MSVESRRRGASGLLGLAVVLAALLAGCSARSPDLSSSACEAWVRHEAETRGFDIEWFPPRTMVQGEQQVVKAAVGTALTSASREPLNDAHCRFHAELGGSGFRATPISSADQSFIDESRRLEWMWTVMPEKVTPKGKPGTLMLTLTPISGTSGLEGSSHMFPARVDVAKGRDPRSNWVKVNEFLAQPVLQAVLGVLLAGASVRTVVAAWRWVRRRRSPAVAGVPLT